MVQGPGFLFAQSVVSILQPASRRAHPWMVGWKQRVARAAADGVEHGRRHGRSGSTKAKGTTDDGGGTITHVLPQGVINASTQVATRACAPGGAAGRPVPQRVMEGRCRADGQRASASPFSEYMLARQPGIATLSLGTGVLPMPRPGTQGPESPGAPTRAPTHPGEILREEFLSPLGITQLELATHVGVPLQRINEIVRGKRGVTPATAWLLAASFGTTPEFWMNLQMRHDLVAHRPTRRIRPLRRTTKT